MALDWWTLAIQAVNVLVLVWLLSRFFWRPVAATIDARRDAAQKLLAEAQSTRQQAEAVRDELTRAREGLADERQAVLAAAQAEAERMRTALLESTKREASTLLESARAALVQERDQATRAWAERANQLALDIARRLLARTGGAGTDALFLDGLLGEIRRLPAAVRRPVATREAALELVSAAPVADADGERYRQAIADALGARVELAFRTDASLLAGLELRGPHLVVSNSWQADLSKISAELANDA